MVRRYVRYERPWTYYINYVLWSMCYGGFWIHWFCGPGATIPNGSVIIGRTSLVGVGHSRSDSICCIMVGALALYYRSLETGPTLLKMGNISGRPCMGVMTYNALAFSASEHLGNYRRFYTIKL
jgi:hypothetical protein